MTTPTDNDEAAGREKRPVALTAGLLELAVVGGASLAVVFWIIPWQTRSADAFGLSPAFVPTICAAAIGFLAALQFLLERGRPAPEAKRKPPLAYAGLLMAATIVGVAATAFLGVIAGGAILVLLASLALDERRPIRIGLLVGGVVAVLALVEQMGL